MSHSTFVLFDKLFDYPPIASLFDSIIQVFSSEDFNAILEALFRNFLNSNVLLEALPGKGCEATGATMGIVVRTISTIHIDYADVFNEYQI